MDVNEREVTIVTNDRSSKQKIVLEFDSIAEARHAVTF
jgi:hypothetical protein